MRRLVLPFFLFPGLVPLILAGCNEGYSPNTYASTAAQEEAAVQRGEIIGVRQVMITANGTIGAAAGGAAGGVAGAQVSGGGVVTALGAIGGTLVGGIGGTAAAQAVADTKGWEYIVQEEPGDKLVSVTQTSKTPLPIGLHVLVIAGTQQARIVPDYTIQVAAAAKPVATTASSNAAAPNGSATLEININPVLPATGAAAPLPDAPITVASDPTSVAPHPAAADSAAAPVAPSSTAGAAGTQEAARSAQAAPGTPIAAPIVSSSAAGSP